MPKLFDLIPDNSLINEFVEKPDYKSAQKYISSGKYFWNSGMFMFKASVFLEELEKYEPEILCACKKSYQNRRCF